MNLKYVLFQNHPNSFNPETEIIFQIPNVQFVSLKIYNTLGKEITTLANSVFEPGTHSLKWDSKDYNGHPVPSGLHLYKIATGEYTKIKKMSLVR
jgi:hypothetical protein